jgi:methyl-accepting chemotaxis protein
VAVYIVVAVFMTRTLISPVLLIADRSRLMAEGDFTRSAMRARGSDEIGAMISSFGSMAGKVSDTVETLKMGINNLSSSSEVLSTTAEELSKAASRQTVRAKEVSAATAQMSLTVSDVARNAVQAADAAKHSSEAAAGGKKIVAMTAERLSLITRTVQESLQTIEALSESSGQIGEIVNLIHTIADQTNLLALNAAIEAARAGEQGRGFAVVADEVRKLADKTATATRDIEQRISSIRTEAQNSLAAIKKGGSEVEKGMDLARSASEALDVIVQSSTQVLDMIQRIAASTEEQSASSEQIKRTMLEISSSVDHSSNASEQIQQSSGNLARLASEIGVMMAWFKTKNGLPASSETVSEQALSTTKPVVHAALVAP